MKRFILQVCLIKLVYCAEEELDNDSITINPHCVLSNEVEDINNLTDTESPQHSRKAFNNKISEDVIGLESSEIYPAPPPVWLKEYLRAPSASESTMTSVNWKYQGNSQQQHSAESEESKSTLIDYPFSVSILRKGSHYATGALIDKEWIITAAGEFFNVRQMLKLFRARLGSVDCKRGGTLLPLKQIEIHPYYIYKKPNFDVALIKLARQVTFSSFIRPVAISEIRGLVLSAKFMTSYWPRVVINGKVLPNTAMERLQHNSMRVSTQTLIPPTVCSENIKDLNEILNESSLCLKPIAAHHSVCMPDAGAPVVADDGVWGVTSGWISPQCPNSPGPTIFTRISSPPVRAWLEETLSVYSPSDPFPDIPRVVRDVPPRQMRGGSFGHQDIQD